MGLMSTIAGLVSSGYTAGLINLASRAVSLVAAAKAATRARVMVRILLVREENLISRELSAQ